MGCWAFPMPIAQCHADNDGRDDDGHDDDGHDDELMAMILMTLLFSIMKIKPAVTIAVLAKPIMIIMMTMMIKITKTKH